MHNIGTRAKAPKATASATRWKEFAESELQFKTAVFNEIMVTIGKQKAKEEEKDKSESPVLKHKIKHELVEFLVDYTMNEERPSIKELLRNGRGFNKYNNKDLVKLFEKYHKKIIDSQDCRYRDQMMERGELIATLIIEREFGL